MTQAQHERHRASKIMSLEARLYLENFVNKQTPRPLQTPLGYFTSAKTSHREYLSKLMEGIIIKLYRSIGAKVNKADDKGQYIDNSYSVTDVIGRVRTIKQVKYIPKRNVEKGAADISFVFKGISYNYEVKIGNDRMSKYQLEEQKYRLENGEQYIIIKNADQFLDIFYENWRCVLIN